ncbi:hypothetical protein BDW60DRAFT_210230 [Aspergillus nidulans var. acristatus]
MAADIGRMSVDRLIQELRDHGYTGEYILHHVIKGVDKASGEMRTLFNQLSPFMVELQELAMSKPDPAVDANLEKALQAF